jgi:hypothetical protein
LFVKLLPEMEADEMSGVVAGQFSVSRLAAALRLVELGYLTWQDYEELPRVDPKGFGRTKEGRDRTRIRADQYGGRALRLVSQGLERDVIGFNEVLDYFDVPEPSLDRLISSVNDR